MEMLKSYYEISPFFFTITASASLLFSLSNLLMIIGGDATDDFFNMGGDHIPSDVAFKFFTTQTILAFFMGFGWAGITLTSKWNIALPYAILIGFTFGLLLMSFNAFLLFQVNKLNHSSKVSMYSALGTKAIIYTRIEENNSGQVQVVISGTKKVVAATSNGESIDSFEEVEVVGVKDAKTLIVRSLIKNTEPNGEKA